MKLRNFESIKNFNSSASKGNVMKANASTMGRQGREGLKC